MRIIKDPLFLFQDQKQMEETTNRFIKLMTTEIPSSHPPSSLTLSSTPNSSISDWAKDGPNPGDHNHDNQKHLKPTFVR